MLLQPLPGPLGPRQRTNHLTTTTAGASLDGAPHGGLEKVHQALPSLGRGLVVGLGRDLLRRLLALFRSVGQ